MPPTHSPPSGPGPRGQDYESARKAKRRKLDSDRNLPAANSVKSFRYGRQGQVEPGLLKMEIASCDPPYTCRPGMAHFPDNMLNNQPSIYYSASSRCNVVLTHQGNTIFNIKEIAIRTPRNLDFTSPVSGGVVFAAMSSDDLLTRTAQYNIPLVTCEAAPTVPFEDDIEMILAHSVGHPLDPAAAARQQSRGMSRAQRRRSRLQQRISDPDDSDQESEYRMAELPTEWINGSGQIRATSQCEYDGDMEDVERHLQTGGRRPPNHIGTLAFEHDTPPDIAQMDDYTTQDYLSLAMHGASQRRNLVDGRDPETGLELEDVLQSSPGAARIGHARDNHTSREQLMIPLALFHMDRDANKCSIKFDTPVCARYLLIKMWSSQVWDEGMAIQSIMVNGFAGPRFVPQLEFR